MKRYATFFLYIAGWAITWGLFIAFALAITGCMNFDGVGIIRGEYGGMREAWFGQAEYCVMVNGPSFAEMNDAAQLEFIRSCGRVPE